MNQTKLTRKCEYTTPKAAELLKVNPQQLRRLLHSRGVQPCGTYRNPHYRSGPPCPLWRGQDVIALRGTNAYGEIVKRNSRPKRRFEQIEADRHAKFVKLDREELLHRAAEGIFNLNRYAKHASCRKEHREEIYSLKSRLIACFCALGLARDVHHHLQDVAARMCFGCDGLGRRDDDERCGRCFGSGNWEEATTLVFVVFHFVIGARPHCWHQPKSQVFFDYVETAEPEKWKGMPAEKEVKLSPQKFAEAKSLMRYVVENLNPDRHCED